ncbi:alpha/beta hydrolase [uncultured Brevundimonas sp.]|uniref:alpha/beta fold hydrolase n=1 Tax=uncultured Brevundimonas sp. TaxID=213418 RepID=UPI0025DDBC3D|nr:alpha/beta hydrolase [uncultured Brevundimonas sp.]
MTTSQPSTTGPAAIWRTTPNRTVAAAGAIFAYRRVGEGESVPLVMLNHWGATLDNFDPRLVDGLSPGRQVITLDYRGVGGSSGKAPLTVAEMAADAIAVIRALGFTEVDLFGFSLGGFVAQDVLRQAPDLVRKVIITGSGPAGGEGIAKVGAVSWPLILKAMATFKDPKYYLFFTSSQNGRNAASAFLKRLKERALNRDEPITPAAFRRQLTAIKNWGLQPSQDLSGLRHPILVANGDHDIMVPSQNSADLARRLPNAELVLYADAGHGGIFQYHEAFIPTARAFLEA